MGAITINGFRFVPLYCRSAAGRADELCLEVTVRVTSRGSAPSGPSWDCPGDPGDPPSFEVIEVTGKGGADLGFLAWEIEADDEQTGELSGAVQYALDDDYREPDGDDYREPDPGPWSVQDLISGRW